MRNNKFKNNNHLFSINLNDKDYIVNFNYNPNTGDSDIEDVFDIVYIKEKGSDKDLFEEFQESGEIHEVYTEIDMKLYDYYEYLLEFKNEQYEERIRGL